MNEDAAVKQLMDAIQSKDLSAAKKLVEAAPALAVKKDASGISPILFAQYRYAFKFVALMLEAGPVLDLFEAAALGKLERVQAILQDKPDTVNDYAADGFFPLALASFYGHLPVAEFLLEQGADVNAAARNDMKIAPLHAAAAGRHVQVVRLLLERGAEVRSRQQGGWTPLHSAVHNKQLELVQLLLEHGAEPHQAKDDGLTPLQMARDAGFEQAVAMMERLR